MTIALVINSGSSSLKYAVIAADTGERLASGSVSRIGDAVGLEDHWTPCGAETRDAAIPDHSAALGAVMAHFRAARIPHPNVVGHRVVHGGDRFAQPCRIDAEVIRAIAAFTPLAPLHNPACLQGIEAALAALPDVPQVAVFDTAFHATIPAPARTYAIDRDVAALHRIRRYGFHGTSHQYVSGRAAAMLGKPITETALITLHLGNGASACAVRGGVSVDTSMGVTPLEGLVMGTRCGDIDPSIPEILGRAGWDSGDVDELLNRRSGLLGLAGAGDMRDIHARADAGDDAAELARQVYVHRIRKYVGAYLLVLGRLDAIVFTAGVGEHDAWTRAAACSDLEALGIAIDPAANAAGPMNRDIARADSMVRVLVIHTDEEHAIAEQAVAAIAAAA